MSRWLSAVNNVLENLDGHTASLAEETNGAPSGQQLQNAVVGRLAQLRETTAGIFSPNPLQNDDSDDSDAEYEEYEDDEQADDGALYDEDENEGIHAEDGAPTPMETHTNLFSNQTIDMTIISDDVSTEGKASAIVDSDDERPQSQASAKTGQKVIQVEPNSDMEWGNDEHSDHDHHDDVSHEKMVDDQVGNEMAPNTPSLDVPVTVTKNSPPSLGQVFPPSQVTSPVTLATSGVGTVENASGQVSHSSTSMPVAESSTISHSLPVSVEDRSGATASATFDSTNTLLPTPTSPLPSPPSTLSSVRTGKTQKIRSHKPPPDATRRDHMEIQETRTRLVEREQELQRLQQKYEKMEQELRLANREIQASQKELDQVGERLVAERLRAEEEQGEILEEHEEEVNELKSAHKKSLDDLRTKYESKVTQLQQQVKDIEILRSQEGGDMTQEIKLALDRENVLRTEFDTIYDARTKLQVRVAELESLNQKLEARITAFSEAAETATQSERRAEEQFEESLRSYQKQIQLRQGREVELEQTIAELGTALTLAQQQLNHNVTNASSRETSASQIRHPFKPEESAVYLELRERCNRLQDEQQQTKEELLIMTERYTAANLEVLELSRERVAETAAFQERQRQHEGQISNLMAQVHHLQKHSSEKDHSYDERGPDAFGISDIVLNRHQQGRTDHAEAITGNKDAARIRQLTMELDKAKRQITALSDQHLRQQTLAENAKSEALALRGRLLAATERAEAAERTQQNSGGAFDPLNSASKLRSRRVKGGHGGVVSSRQPGRSMRTLLGLRIVPHGSSIEQLALTIDSIDSWMLDTGMILQHEPLPSVLFSAYLLLLHAWCFGLVLFHAVESEHGDINAFRAHHKGIPVLVVPQVN